MWPLQDELANTRLFYGTLGVPEPVQSLVEEQVHCSPGMLTVWHRSWCALLGQKLERPLEEVFKSEVHKGLICVLGDDMQQQCLLRSSRGGLPAPVIVPPDELLRKTGSREPDTNVEKGVAMHLEVACPEEAVRSLSTRIECAQGSLDTRGACSAVGVDSLVRNLRSSTQTCQESPSVAVAAVQQDRRLMGAKTIGAKRSRTQVGRGDEEVRAGPSGPPTRGPAGMHGSGQGERLEWKCYSRFMNTPEVHGIGKCLGMMVREARKHGLESEKALVDFLRLLSTSLSIDFSRLVQRRMILTLLDLRYFEVDTMQQVVSCAMSLVREVVARFVDQYDQGKELL